MKEKAFQEYLINNDVSQEQISIFISRLNEFNTYLKKENSDIDSIHSGGIIKYSEFLVKKDNEAVLDFLRALFNYANFIKNYDYIIEIIDISESYNAMDNLYQRVAEKYGEKLQDEIFENIVIPPLGVHPEKKPEFTKIVMKRLEEKLGEEKTIELLKPCLHGRPGSIKEVADIIRKYGGRMVSILSTYQRVPNGYRKVYIRMYGVERQRLPDLKKDLRGKSTLLYVIDHRENKREIFEEE